jgi:hypothetical protein
MDRKKILRLVSTIFLFLALPAGVVLVSSAVRYFSRASGLTANLVVDMSTDYGVSPDAWRYLAQGGEDKGRMLAPIIPQIRALQPEYIRIDHVFDFYDNNQKLDEVIGDITATGAKPFIALSYMPPSISKSGDVNDYPKNWVDWENQVQKIIEHVSGSGGLAISGVYYEVWNEPDLFGDYKIGGSKNYLELYLHTAIGAGRAVNTLPFKFGGPATTGYYKNWMTGLIDYVANNNLRLDFLSWHKYSKNIDDYLQDVDAARGLLASYNMPDKELIISEMGPNGAVDPVYDNNFGAIHEIATSVVLQNEVDKTFTFEIKDGAASETKYWGRWGLYTNEKFGVPEEKPRAKAFRFLNNMIGGSKLNIFGQGSWVRAMAKKLGNNITRILVVNYDPKGSHEEMVPITLSNLSSQNFTFKRIDFLGGSNSEEVATTSGQWATSQYFKPNSAAIFEVVMK